MSIVARSSVAAALLILVAAASGPSPRGESAIQVPQDDEDAAYREAMVRKSLQENCLICHTEDMIAGQRLTPAKWKAEVNKMVNWGSPLPKESASPLVEYLARRFSDQAAPTVPARATLKEIDSLGGRDRSGRPGPAGRQPAQGERLYAANCGICTARPHSAATRAPAWPARRSWIAPRV